MLAPFAQGDPEGFHAWVSKEAELLAEGAFGPQMLAEVNARAGWDSSGVRLIPSPAQARASVEIGTLNPVHS